MGGTVHMQKEQDPICTDIEVHHNGTVKNTPVVIQKSNKKAIVIKKKN